MRGFFVTGTDTGVGKTVACAALLSRLKPSGPIRYWKPIQTGIEEDDDTATVRALTGIDGRDALDEGIRLKRPVSPHLAARLNGVTIVMNDLVKIAAAQPFADRWIVEGAGGVLVPLNSDQLMVDLMLRLALPVIVVSRTSLGTINHTLLTLEALRSRGLSVVGVIMVGDKNPDNRDAIERYGHVPVVGELPVLKPLTPDTLQGAASQIDREGVLSSYLDSDSTHRQRDQP